MFMKKKKLFKLTEDCSEEMAKYLHSLIKTTKKEYTNICVLCIGTDRSTGDSYAPLVGMLLSELSTDKYIVLGTLDNPVHAKNLKRTISDIDEDNTLIIAVDACLRRTDHVGMIEIREGGLAPGAGMGKDLGIVGDISIAGIVNFGGYMDFMILQNTRLSLVMNLAKQTHQVLSKTLSTII